MSFHQSFAEWSQWFWLLLANHLWQATLFAVVAWAATLALKRSSARARHAVWLIAMAKFLLPAAWLAPALGKLGLEFSRAGTAAAAFSPSALILWESAQPAAELNTQTPHPEIYCVLTVAWLMGAIGILARWQLRRWRLAGALRANSSAASGRVAENFAELQTRFGFHRGASLLVSARMAGPGVWGIWQPKIILPPGLTEQLHDDELRAVLLHELVHIRQRDNLLGTLQMFVCCLFWFHPVIWLVDRRLLCERELVCDERVIRFGGAVDAYAAGLWKAVQHGLGWPVAGVSQVTGSNLKRRIELMLSKKHVTKSSTANRLLAAATVWALIVCAVAMSAFTRDRVRASGMIAAPQQDAVIVPMRFANPLEIPLVITELQATLSEPKQTASSGVAPDGQRVQLVHKGGNSREMRLVVRMLNQGQRPISRFSLLIQNPSFWPGNGFSITSPVITEDENAADKDEMIPPQGAYTLKTSFTLDDRKSSVDLMNAINDFTIKVALVQFEFEKVWLSEREPDNLPNLTGMMLMKRSRSNRIQAWQSLNDGVTREAGAQQEKQGEGGTYEMGVSRRPNILFREKAQYTKEARDEKVEGTVVLNIVFGADGRLTDIKVVRGLSHGLTEAAIEAAKAIRFEPAMRDGQPISVRGNIEYSFRLEESVKQDNQ